MYIYIYTHTHKQTHTHTHVHTNSHTCTHNMILILEDQVAVSGLAVDEAGLVADLKLQLRAHQVNLHRITSPWRVQCKTMPICWGHPFSFVI